MLCLLYRRLWLEGRNEFPEKPIVWSADLFLPNRRLIVEVHGEQHYKFNTFFFKTKLEFYQARARDNDKREWCRINDIELVEFNYDEDIDDWRRKIQ